MTDESFDLDRLGEDIRHVVVSVHLGNPDAPGLNLITYVLIW